MMQVITKHDDEILDIFNINLEANRCRSKSFYDDILKIKNLIIVDRKSNQIELIDNSKFVVIQTSNIGLEAAVRGKSVLSFGPTWFDNFYNVMRWSEFDEYNSCASNFGGTGACVAMLGAFCAFRFFTA